MVTAQDPSGAAWRKGSRSSANGACVEVGKTPGGVAVRDSKDPDGPRLTLQRTAWRTFHRHANSGMYDL